MVRWSVCALKRLLVPLWSVSASYCEALSQFTSTSRVPGDTCMSYDIYDIVNSYVCGMCNEVNS